MNRIWLSLALAAIPALAAPPEEAEEEKESVEAEFVASDIFRAGSLIVPVVRKLAFEGHYFGGTQTDVGHVGMSWTFAWKELKLSPGFGVTFGSNQFTTTPSFTLRVAYEKKWFVAEGLMLQGFRKTPIFAEEEEGEEGSDGEKEPVGFVRPTIADGNHVSVRWRRMTIGGTWEHIEFREGTEWKGGGRLAIRILPRISGILYVYGPGRAEWRGGILIHGPKE